jgi:uncharacterized protein YcfJ
MFRRTAASLIVVIFTMFGFAGCATETYQQHPGATTGAGAGAATGALIGGVIGHQSGSTAGGVIIGALLGGLAGTAVGHYGYDQKRTEPQAQQQYAYDYNQSSAHLVRIEDVSTNPRTVSPGQSMELQVTYTILGPAGSAMSVTETREIRQDGQLVGKPTVTVQHQGGTYSSKIPLTLAGDAHRGTYVVITSVQSGNSSDSREGTFVVQ